MIYEHNYWYTLKNVKRNCDKIISNGRLLYADIYIHIFHKADKIINLN